VLTKADYEIRGSAQPRYHLEMALLRWIHLRKLVPLSDLIEGLDKGGPAPSRTSVPPPAASRTAPAPTVARPAASVRPPAVGAATVKAVEARREVRPPAAAPPPAVVPSGRPASGELKDAFLEELRRTKKYFHGTVVAMAQRIEHAGDRIVFTFGPHHRALRAQLERDRAQLEDLASRLAGRRINIVSAEDTPAVGAAKPGAAPGSAAPPDERKTELKQQALEDSGVQAMLDVFAAEIKDVEER